MIDPSILRFIAITDNVRDGQDGLVERAVQVVRGGATCIQLRLKDVAARDLVTLARELVRAVSVPVIVNDRADVAISAGAAGVHLGADDLPVNAVRKFAPEGFIIGTSVGLDSEIPNARGADYVGIGPVFKSASKKDAGIPIGVEGFKRFATATGIPAVGMGGMTAENAASVMAAGAAGVAAIASIFSATDPFAAAREMASAIGK